MENAEYSFFSPPGDYSLGIRGGPILADGIYNSSLAYESLKPGAERYAMVYSPVTPTGQRLAITVALSGLMSEIAVVSTAMQTLVERGRGTLQWRDTRRRERHAFELAGHVRLPALVDLDAGQVVSNDPYRLPTKIVHELGVDTAKGTGRLSVSRRDAEQIDMDERIFYDLHAAVYRAGFVSSQKEYEAEVRKVYDFLFRTEERLRERRYLFGEELTLSDVWLFTLLIRYDQVYAPGFRLHKYRIRDFGSIHRYMRELYAMDEFQRTTNFDEISRGYFLGIPALNRGIIPDGPNSEFLA